MQHARMSSPASWIQIPGPRTSQPLERVYVREYVLHFTGCEGGQCSPHSYILQACLRPYCLR